MMIDAQWHSFARHLAIHAPPLSAEGVCHYAFTLLTDNPHWPGLAVLDDDGAILGLLSRRTCLSILAKPLMLDLYAKRPVSRIMSARPLIVQAGDSVDDIGALISARHPDALVDGFIVADGGRYVGVASPVSLLALTSEQARRRAEQLEEARRAAEAANEAKSTFLANLSHEIRTPLNGVLANLELLGRTDTDAEQTELVGAASVAAQALLEIIGDVLDLSKIEAGKLAIEAIPTEPAAILRDIAVLSATQARQRGLELGSHVEPSAELVVAGDPTRLRQVVLNIAGNAMKFTRAGGVFLHLLRMDDGMGDTAQLMVEVTDTGAGFAPNKAASLFEAFSQEDSSTTRRFGGTGLGLAICKRLVELMGGAIGAEGRPESGASFWFTLPVTMAEAPSLPAPVELRGLSALLVGEDAPRRERLKGMLEQQGLTVATAPSVPAAAHMLAVAVRPFDLLLVPVSDDDDAALNLPAACRTLSTVPVMLVQRDDRSARRAGYGAGFRHMAALPARPADLSHALAVAAGRLRAVTVATAPDDGLDLLVQDLAARAGARILVVDDNQMNREVARRQLDKLGFSCETAEHGRAALALATAPSRRPFDLVLCDCQMPDMDGYDFTRALRAWEAERSGRRTPVIALTAHAMQGDDEKCRAAGMDFYLTKPVRITRLADILRTWLPAPGGEEPAPPPESMAVDLEALAHVLDDDTPQVMLQVLELFVECFPPVGEELEKAAARRDLDGVRRAAHSGKGMARNAGAAALGDLFRDIEARAAENGDWPAIDALAMRMGGLFADVRDTVQSLSVRG